MHIAVIGRGNVGGGLARRWEKAGHIVTQIGREGGDVSDADVVVVAVPAPSIPYALGKVQGLAGKIAVDAADDGARPVVEQLIRDAGYDPTSIGGLDKARALEEFAGLLGGIDTGSGGGVPFFYRYAPPGRL